MTRRAFLHIGSPKTGTTFLQDVLWRERERLAASGLHVVGRSIHDHFHAALDVRQIRGRAADPERVDGAWRRLVDNAAEVDGDIVISHEMLAPATGEQAGRAVASLVDVGLEVHVILTARDMARQIPAEWQERLKHRATHDFADFIAFAQEPGTPTHLHLWAAQDYTAILRRWGDMLGPDRRHVVTVPPSGSPRTLLWERFAGVLDVHPDSVDTTVDRKNSSLGHEQATLLRMVNQRIDDRLSLPGAYTTVVKAVLAHNVLEAHPGTRLLLGGDDLRFARRVSAEQVAGLRDLGVQVAGDLDDLLVPETAADAEVSSARTELTVDDLLTESVSTLVDLLYELRVREMRDDARRAVLRQRIRTLRTEKKVLLQELAQAKAQAQAQAQAPSRIPDRLRRIARGLRSRFR